ncbi:MAG: DNA-binding protein [Patescibacteria group bacterium]
MNKTYTVKQVADILGYSTNSIYTFLKEGQIVGIRIGEGRYRVSQEELNKILHLKKSQEMIPEPTVIRKSTPVVEPIKDSIPTLFDWFISLVSIILGLSLVLFVRYFEEPLKIPLSELVFPMKINFLIAGMGLFIVNLFNRARKKAFFIFYLIIFINFLAFSTFLYLGKDILGSFFFVLMPIVMIFHIIFNKKGTISFAILVTILTIFSPIIMILTSSVIELSEIIKATGLDRNVVILLWSILVIIVNLYIWLFKKEKKLINQASFIVIATGLGYFIFLYSAQLYWSRALVNILIIIFLFILSFWDEINENSQENQRIKTRVFISLTLIFFVGTAFIWVIQNNIHSYVQNELVNKLVYGRNLSESMILTSKDKLEILSKNKSLIEAIKKNNIDTLDGLIKDVFQYSSTFRRVLVADEKGNLLTNYPYVNVDYANIGFRDYFKQVKETKKSYLSNIFQSSADGQKRYVVSINVPVLDEENNFRGILIGSFDINSLANKLQSIANTKNKEYFIMVDKLGGLIISPGYVNQLTETEIRQLVGNVSKGVNIEETLELENRSLQIHDKVDDKEWTIAIRRPLLNTYNFDKLTNFLIVFSLIGFSLLVIYLNIFHLKK